MQEKIAGVFAKILQGMIFFICCLFMFATCIPSKEENKTIIKEPLVRMECEHLHTSVKTIYEPTCTSSGLKYIYCMDCGFRTSSIKLEPLGHEEGESEVLVEATCIKEGVNAVFCTRCNAQLYTLSVSKTDCQFSDWQIIKAATSLEEGKKEHKCKVCGKTEELSFKKEIGAYHIYIPGTGIDHDMYFASTAYQEDVDAHDIVYTNNINGVVPVDCILGHNNKSLGSLYKVQTGQDLYIWINGEMIEMTVYVSEHGRDIGNDIIDFTKAVHPYYSYIENNSKEGYSLKNARKDTDLRLYTCYHTNTEGSDSRWLVLARPKGESE